MAPAWTHLIRFVAEETGQIHLGQIDAKVYPDVGIASVEGKTIKAKEITGTVFDGVVTEKVLTVKQVFSSLTSLMQVTFSSVKRASQNCAMSWFELSRCIP
jgi:hypothetical protein